MKLKFISIAILLIPLLAFAQDTGKKKAYYFYGEQCPHCKNVDEYFQANGIYDKYDISKLEFSNPFNARLLVKFGEQYNSEYKGSVPAVAFADKFIVGDQPIMDNFVKEIDASGDAFQLPDPDKTGTSQNSPADSSAKKSDLQKTKPPAESRNKKNYFPVLLVALIAIGGGALIFVNRKKT